MKTAIVNLGAIVTGDWRDPYAKGDSILMAEGKIVSVGTSGDLKTYDVVIDADGATAIPGVSMKSAEIPRCANCNRARRNHSSFVVSSPQIKIAAGRGPSPIPGTKYAGSVVPSNGTATRSTGW